MCGILGRSGNPSDSHSERERLERSASLGSMKPRAALDCVWISRGMGSTRLVDIRMELCTSLTTIRDDWFTRYQVSFIPVVGFQNKKLI